MDQNEYLSFYLQLFWKLECTMGDEHLFWLYSAKKRKNYQS